MTDDLENIVISSVFSCDLVPAATQRITDVMYHFISSTVMALHTPFFKINIQSHTGFKRIFHLVTVEARFPDFTVF